jgi:hypothetical protein
MKREACDVGVVAAAKAGLTGPALGAPLALLTSVLMLGGCLSAPDTRLEPAKPSALPQQAPIVAPQPAQPSALSYGMVTSQVRKGETRQLELVQLFGSPNISSYDSAGIETWVYERSVRQTDVQQNSQAAQGAANLGAFFNFGQASAGVSGSQSSGSTTTTTSLRSITVIVKFTAEHIVSDYSVRATTF